MREGDRVQTVHGEGVIAHMRREPSRWKPGPGSSWPPQNFVVVELPDGTRTPWLHVSLVQPIPEEVEP